MRSGSRCVTDCFECASDDFDEALARMRSLPLRYYSAATLASPHARETWVPPDLRNVD